MTRHDAVEEAPVWLEVNGESAVTWMCTPDQLPELVVGWLYGEGYIDSRADLISLRPCSQELGFWAEVPRERYETVEGMERRRVLASGCGAVTTILGSLSSVPRRETPPAIPDLAQTRKLFKELFTKGARYNETGGIHAAALTDGVTLLTHAEDIGRHNAVDKVLGAMVMAGRRPDDLILLVTGRISGELAFKAARARLAVVATPSVPSMLAVEIAQAAGMALIGRAVSGEPQVWTADDGRQTRHCVGVILAGGGATRFGGSPKGLQLVDGARIIDRVAGALREAADELLLIANDPAAVEWLPGVRTAPDARTGEGALGGLHAALTHSAGHAVLVVAWDMPFVSAGLLRALRAAGEQGFDAAVPESESSGRGVEPLCAWYAPTCLAAIERRLDVGDRRVVSFFEEVRVARLPAADVAQWGDPGRIFFNVNSPGDLTSAPPP